MVIVDSITAVAPSFRQPMTGIRLDDYFPFFQPIVDITTGSISGYEALARTKNMRGEVVSAGGVFNSRTHPIDEVIKLDRYLRRKSLALFAHQREAGFISLNISPHWIDRLRGEDPLPTLEMIDELGMDPERVVIEITENHGDPDNLKRFVSRCHRHGVKVAIDDFGAGASQLDRIAELGPDLIKLDMALFKTAVRGGLAADVVLSITAIAKRAGSRIVCEGVENEREFHFAVECGADLVQGWLYAPALPHLLDSSASVSQTYELKQSYLQRKKVRLYESASHSQQVSTFLRHLSDLFRLSPHLTIPALSTYQCKRLRDLGVIRFYLCDQHANQLSPNYEVMLGQIKVVDAFASHNWAHRPYFPLLLGVSELSPDQIVVSDAYRDRCGQVLCKTYVLFLSSRQVLLVDVEVEDDILF